MSASQIVYVCLEHGKVVQVVGDSGTASHWIEGGRGRTYEAHRIESW
jgi:hypothetical protein